MLDGAIDCWSTISLDVEDVPVGGDDLFRLEYCNKSKNSWWDELVVFVVFADGLIIDDDTGPWLDEDEDGEETDSVGWFELLFETADAIKWWFILS